MVEYDYTRNIDTVDYSLDTVEYQVEDRHSGRQTQWKTKWKTETVEDRDSGRQT